MSMEEQGLHVYLVLGFMKDFSFSTCAAGAIAQRVSHTGKTASRCGSAHMLGPYSVERDLAPLLGIPVHLRGGRGGWRAGGASALVNGSGGGACDAIPLRLERNSSPLERATEGRYQRLSPCSLPTFNKAPNARAHDPSTRCRRRATPGRSAATDP